MTAHEELARKQVEAGGQYVQLLRQFAERVAEIPEPCDPAKRITFYPYKLTE